MSDRELERLREAFGDLAEEGLPGDDCPPPDRIWAAAAGKLRPTEAGLILDHVARHPACAEAWRLAREILEHGEEPAVGSRSRRPRSRAVAAAAAVAFLAAGIVWMSPKLFPPDGGEVFRQGPGLEIRSLVPEETSLARTRFLLRWSPGPDGSLYRVRVLTVDSELVAESHELERSEYLVSESALEPVPSRAQLLWQVEMRLSDGTSRLSETFVVEVE